MLGPAHSGVLAVARLDWHRGVKARNLSWSQLLAQFACKSGKATGGGPPESPGCRTPGYRRGGKVPEPRLDMAVHGRFGQPCPICATKVQRIVYSENETNYCPLCQTGGKVLADRSLSRLLKDDWPRSVEELEEGKA